MRNRRPRKTLVAILAATSCSWTSEALAEDGPEFELSRPKPDSGAVQIVGGDIASVGRWPATWVFKSATGSPCTATAVGPRVLLIAAHCLNDGAKGIIVGTKIRIWCDRPATWTLGYDVALCATSGNIPIRAGEPYETLDTRSPAAPGQLLVLLGYGCTRSGGSGGTLYQGVSDVDPASDVRTIVTRGGAALCAGDSGGGAYRGGGDDRKIVGVASTTIIDDRQSNFTALSSPHVLNWIGGWQGRQTYDGQTVEVRICGINGKSTQCRS